jgi:hypothetical protein
MYDDYERVKLLFEYTKFHIGVYLTLASILVGILGLKQDFGFVVIPQLLVISIILIMIAGAAGGTIVSRLTKVKTYDEFYNEMTGPVRAKWFRGEIWTYIEHLTFWAALIFALLAILLPTFAPSNSIMPTW